MGGGSTVIEPGEEPVTIPAYTDKELTVAGDVNLLPQNIASGVSIFGVTGTLENVESGTFIASEENSITLNFSRKVSNVIIGNTVHTHSLEGARVIISASILNVGDHTQTDISGYNGGDKYFYYNDLLAFAPTEQAVIDFSEYRLVHASYNGHYYLDGFGFNGTYRYYAW